MDGKIYLVRPFTAQSVKVQRYFSHNFDADQKQPGGEQFDFIEITRVFYPYRRKVDK